MMKLAIVPPLIMLLLVASNAGSSSDPRHRDLAFEETANLEISPMEPDAGTLYQSAAVDTYCIVWYSFEWMNWQGWTQEHPRGSSGTRSKLVRNLADRDPCGDNLGTQIVFFVGTGHPSWDGRRLFDTPFWRGHDNTTSPGQDVVVISPVIDLTRYSTGRNESQDATIPVGDLPALGGCSLRFTVYRDLPLRNLVFYVWRVRSIENGRPGEWLDRNLAYYGDGEDYAFITESIGDLVASDSIQVAVGVVDMCDAWYGAYGSSFRRRPGPWIDSVRLYRYRSAGPQWSCRDIDLFQDNFPPNEVPPWETVRADAARDINPRNNPIIRPGDSIVVSCASPLGGGIATANDLPAVYLHVNAHWIGSGTPPPALGTAIHGAQLQGTYGSWISTTAGWDIIQGEHARTQAGVIEHKYMFDLNDSLFVPGYIIEYYFTAKDNAGIETALPRWARSIGPYFEFTCLPTGASDVLFVDDCSGRGSFRGSVDDSWLPVFYAVLPVNNRPDRYDVNGPSSAASNGLGSRANAALMAYQYSRVVWDSGDLQSCTISDGTVNSDKSDDCALLSEWLRSSEHRVGLWVCGDDIANDLIVNDELSPSALDLMTSWCGVALVNTSYYELTGVVSPFVRGTPTGIFYHTGIADTALVFGGCWIVNRFDVLEPVADAAAAISYSPPRSVGCAAVQRVARNAAGYPVRTMWFGFSYQYLRYIQSPKIRFELAKDVFSWMQIARNDLWTASPGTPGVATLAQNFPNPFNPSLQSTFMNYDAEHKGFVEINVYDVTGRMVRTLVREVRPAGRWVTSWDGTNDKGVVMPSGIYFCRMRAGETVTTRKIVLVR